MLNITTKRVHDYCEGVRVHEYVDGLPRFGYNYPSGLAPKSKLSRRLFPDEQPVAFATGQYCRYGLYLIDVPGAVPKRQVAKRPAELIDVMAAVWGLNRRAKRCRDMGMSYYEFGLHSFAKCVKEEKLDLYFSKGQAIHYLVMEDRLSHAGYHRFGDNFAEVLKGEGYTFHRPCPPPTSEGQVEILDAIEAKPRGRREPRLKDARLTVSTYLKDKPAVNLFEWPVRKPFRFHLDDIEDWFDDDEDEDYFA